MTRLDKVECNKSCIIEKIFFKEEKQARRMCELGFVCGQKVMILKKSPLSRVFLLEIRGGVLSVRKNLVEGVFVV